jgi:hypothetical protein
VKLIYFMDSPTLQNTIRRMSSEVAAAVARLGYPVKFLDEGPGLREFSDDFNACKVGAIVAFNMYWPKLNQLAEILGAANVHFFFTPPTTPITPMTAMTTT